MWYNKIMVGILRSPIHSMLSKGVLIIGFTGSKSGKEYSTPANYYEIDGKIYLMSDRSRKWWKNIKKKPNVELYIKRQLIKGTGTVIDAKSEIEKSLELIFSHFPKIAKYLKVEIVDGKPVMGDIQKLSDSNIVIVVELSA